MNMPTEVLIPAGGLLLAVLGYLAGQRQSASESGKQDGVVLTEIGFIKSSVEDIKTDIKEHRKSQTEILTRLAKVEGSAKRAHERLNQIDEDNRRRKEQ